ncbi:PepSY domain-containing protein [Cohnella kolymensis]|uniref:PepSY domain-containing protein n=1 Tax=Cohnella kolymensis TaxID=1590652 RepID=UPI0006982624|nr:PepSY domain-containing protein [Cohnella kolymensis]
MLTAADASLLAAKQVKGTVKDVDLRQTKAGAYYLVEIRGGKEKKAVVQINAITGAIMSVTWDDHDRGDGQPGKRGGSDDSGKHSGDDDNE